MGDFLQFYLLNWIGFVDLILFFSMLGGLKVAFDTFFNGENPLFLLIVLFVFMGTFQNQWELLDIVKESLYSKEMTKFAINGTVFSFMMFFIAPIFVCIYFQEKFKNFNIDFFKSCYFVWMPSNILLCFESLKFGSFIEILMCFIYIQCLQFVALFFLKFFVNSTPIFNCKLN